MNTNSYAKPVVIENSEMFEGVYALESGFDPKADVSIRWSSHNSGSHSDLSVDVKCYPNTSGQYLKATVTFVGKGTITAVGGFSTPGNTEASWDGSRTITFVRNGTINQGESFQFGFNNVVFSETGDNHDTKEHVGSYYETGTHIGSAEGDFVVDLQIS